MSSTEPKVPGASLSDILTAIKNLVIAVNGAAQAYLNVNGQSTLEGITTATVVKISPGRVCTVSVITAGSATGMVYDSNATSNTTAPLYVIPTTVGTAPYVVNMGCNSGILVVPGTGQKVTVGWS